MLSKTHPKEANKRGAYDSPYNTGWGVAWTKANVIFSPLFYFFIFRTTQLVRGRMCVEWIVFGGPGLRLHAPLAPYERLPVDDTWARVSSFRADGERIGKKTISTIKHRCRSRPSTPVATVKQSILGGATDGCVGRIGRASLRHSRKKNLFPAGVFSGSVSITLANILE